MDTPNLISGREPLARLRLAGVALAGLLAAAGAATAAPCADEDCRDLLRGLISPPLALHAPSVRTVDLGDVDSADPASAAATSVTPLLYLAPRVASVLEEVFGDERSTAAPELPTAELPPAPLAGARAVDESEGYTPLAPADNAGELPKFQRQMYRTDI